MIAQLAIGFLSGLFFGVAVFSHALSRAVVVGMIAGIMIGAIAVDGPEGYVKWATYLPAEMTRLSAFWIGLMAGVLSAGLWSERRAL
jgi:hypothetical protein